jgi:hypothetical protein
MLLIPMPGPPVIETARHRVGIRWRSECRDLFQVQFHGPRIFVHFPYQPDAPGILNRVEVPPGNTHNINVTDSADATTRHVKYSHPIDGHAHFSQDGQIITTIRNQAQPLDRSIGHLFSVDVSGISLFRKCSNKVPSLIASTQFLFDNEYPPDPLHCAGFWFKLEECSPEGMTNPVIVDLGNEQRQGIAIAPPKNSSLHGWVLIIFPRYGPEELAAEPDKFRLVFVGGFAANLHHISEPSSFLTMQYPADNVSVLRIVDYAGPSN